jgi:hypothetical protein
MIIDYESESLGLMDGLIQLECCYFYFTVDGLIGKFV